MTRTVLHPQLREQPLAVVASDPGPVSISVHMITETKIHFISHLPVWALIVIAATGTVHKYARRLMWRIRVFLK